MSPSSSLYPLGATELQFMSAQAGRGVFGGGNPEDRLYDNFLQANEDAIWSYLTNHPEVKQRGLQVTAFDISKRIISIRFNDKAYYGSIQYHPYKTSHYDKPYDGDKSVIFMINKDHKVIFEEVKVLNV